MMVLQYGYSISSIPSLLPSLLSCIHQHMLISTQHRHSSIFYPYYCPSQLQSIMYIGVPSDRSQILRGNAVFTIRSPSPTLQQMDKIYDVEKISAPSAVDTRRRTEQFLTRRGGEGQACRTGQNLPTTPAFPRNLPPNETYPQTRQRPTPKYNPSTKYQRIFIELSCLYQELNYIYRHTRALCSSELHILYLGGARPEARAPTSFKIASSAIRALLARS